MKRLDMREVTLDLGRREPSERRGPEDEGLEKSNREGHAEGKWGAAGDDRDGTKPTNDSGEHSKYFSCVKMGFFPK